MKKDYSNYLNGANIKKGLIKENVGGANSLEEKKEEIVVENILNANYAQIRNIMRKGGGGNDGSTFKKLIIRKV